MLHCLGLRLRQVVKAQPHQKIAAPAAIVTHSKKDQEAAASPSIQRLSLDGKATVAIGDGSGGGRTRGAHRVCAHALGLHEQYIPCGSVDADSAQLRLPFGSSCKTSDGSVDALEAWGAA